MLTALVVLAALSNDIDAFARKAMDTVGTTPAMTIVVVKDDRVIHRADYGLRDVEAKLPVTPDTRFYIGSTTKAFTAMAALILAEEGKVELDAPITKYWPELKLTPPLDAARFTLRDFLAMRPGLQNDTSNFRAGSPANIESEAELLRILTTYSRETPRTFRYSNMSYNFVGEIIERAAGKSWQELSHEKVFAPLGMTSTTSDVPPSDKIAHVYRSSARNVFVRNIHKINANMGPAGGTFMTSADAAKWLIAMMNDGRVNGVQVLPKRAVRMTMSPQTTNKARFNYFDRWAWGIGQDLGEYEGELFVHRFGGYHGAYSHTSFMPERRIGVAVFATGGNAVADAVAAYTYDLLLGKKDLDAKWSKELERLAANAQKAREERAAAYLPRANAARPLAQYTGAFHNDRLGGVTFEREGDKLFTRWGVLRAELIPIGGDEFQVDWESEGAPVKVRFAFDENGRVSRFEWDERIWTRVSAP